MFSVSEKTQDSSGKWYVRVVIDENTTHFFTFDTDPTQEEVDAKAQKYVDILAEIASQIPEGTIL